MAKAKLAEKKSKIESIVVDLLHITHPSMALLQVSMVIIAEVALPPQEPFLLMVILLNLLCLIETMPPHKRRPGVHHPHLPNNNQTIMTSFWESTLSTMEVVMAKKEALMMTASLLVKTSIWMPD